MLVGYRVSDGILVLGARVGVGGEKEKEEITRLTPGERKVVGDGRRPLGEGELGLENCGWVGLDEGRLLWGLLLVLVSRPQLDYSAWCVSVEQVISFELGM